MPLLITGEGVIIDGHLRYKAAKRLRLKSVPCIIVDDLTPAQIKALRLSVNKMADLADWDYDLLADELKELATMDFDLGLTGFEGQELADLLGDSTIPEEPRAVDIKHVDMESLAPTPEELAKLEGRMVLVEYSGGKDSTAAVLWARKYLPDSPIRLLYVDMGADFVGMQKYLEEAALFLGAPLKVLRSRENLFRAFLTRGAWPQFSFPFCHELLHEALDNEVRSYKPKDIVILRGGRAAEKARRSKKLASRFLSIERNKEYIYFQPLYYAEKTLCERILEQAKVPVWEGYAQGLQRTACRICPGQKPRAYAVIRAKYPEVWAEIKWLEGRLRYGPWRGLPHKAKPSFDELADKGEAQIKKGEV